MSMGSKVLGRITFRLFYLTLLDPHAHLLSAMYCLKGLSAKVLGSIFFRLFYLTPYFDHLTIPALGCYN